MTIMSPGRTCVFLILPILSHIKFGDLWKSPRPKMLQGTKYPFFFRFFYHLKYYKTSRSVLFFYHNFIISKPPNAPKKKPRSGKIADSNINFNL